MNRYLSAMEDDEEPQEYWGTMGAGALFYAEPTGRVCVQKRSQHVNEPGTWGTWGGAIDAGESVAVGLKRELMEETSYRGHMKMVPVSVFRKERFQYHNFLAIVEDEFNPRHSWETSGHEWVEIGEIPSPIHYGLKFALSAFKGEVAKLKRRSELGNSLLASTDMNKIADADELERELCRILAYNQGELPSRTRLASELLQLSERVKTAGMTDEEKWNLCLWRANDKKIMPGARVLTVSLKYNGTELATKTEVSYGKKRKPSVDYFFTAAAKKLFEESEAKSDSKDE